MTSKYLIHGTYGCVVIPGYDCQNNLLNDDTVTKLFADKDGYELEYKIQETIKRLDNESRFTIKMIDKCELTNKDILSTITDFYKCPLITSETINVYQITYEYGGKELPDLFISTETFNSIKILKQFVNMFEGLCILDENNIIHQDVKQNNILYDEKKQKFNLIDFGLYTTKDKVYENLIHNINYVKYIYYPPEYSFFYYKYYNIPIETISTKLYIINVEKDIDFLLKVKPIALKYKIAILKVYNSLNKSNNELKAIYDKFSINQPFVYKIDVYMLGLTLFDFMINIFCNLNSQDKINIIPVKIFDLIIKMTEIDPYKRITIQEATQIYKSLFSHIK